MGKLLEERRTKTAKRIERLRARLDDAQRLCGSDACVYATGSFGRGEASSHSDLDLFIAGLSDEDKKSRLKHLDEILIKADLIRTTRALDIPEFSGDGEYLTHHSLGSLVERLGTPEDDAGNTFTARLLLLLESSPLLGEVAYKRITTGVIDAYWRDYSDHTSEFMPAFLANDILRMWRTFCVNYEARTETEPPEKKAKRKLKNYKLKHSRLLTCYSALLYLLSVYSKHGTVTPADAAGMISLTPTKRLEWLLSDQSAAGAQAQVRQLIDLYEVFLEATDVREADLISRFLDREQSVAYVKSSYRFGDLIFQVMSKIGKGNTFHRLLVV